MRRPPAIVVTEAVDLARRCVTASCSDDLDLLIEQLDEFSDDPLVLTGVAVYLAMFISGLTETCQDLDIKTMWGEVMLDRISAGE